MRNAEIIRRPDSVFVSVAPPDKIQQAIDASGQARVWAKVAATIANETANETPTELSQPKPTPTADELLVSHLPKHIAASRWGFYITPCAKSRVFDSRIFVYHNPTPPFWNLYNLAKGIFRDLGILLTKNKGTWEARIPIHVLTDKVFVQSGLAGVEQALRRGTKKEADASIASKISDGIRHRQFADTRKGMEKVKKMREGLADAAGVVAITAVSWFALIVCGGVI